MPGSGQRSCSQLEQMGLGSLFTAMVFPIILFVGINLLKEGLAQIRDPSGQSFSTTGCINIQCHAMVINGTGIIAYNTYKALLAVNGVTIVLPEFWN